MRLKSGGNHEINCHGHEGDELQVLLFSGANGPRHVAGLHLLVGIDEKVIETFDAN